MNKRLDIKELSCYIVLLFWVLINSLLNFNVVILNNISAFFVLIIPLFLAIKFRFNPIMFLFFFILSYYNYSIVFSRYINFISFEYTEFYNNVTIELYGLSINILMVFCFILAFSFKKFPFKYKYSEGYFFSNNKNVFVVLIFLFGILLCNLFGLDKSMFGLRGSISSIYEYATILFIFAFYYCGKSKFLKFLVSLTAILYTFQGFVYGERITGLQILVVVYIYIYSSKLNYKKMLVVGLLGIIGMSFLGSYRSDYSISLQSFILNIKNIFENRMLTFNGMDLAYYCSLTFLLVRKEISFIKEIDLFMKFLYSIFLGFSKVPEANLGTYTRNFYWHYNGGIYPIYFYFYLGWIGVIFFSFISRFILKLIGRVYKNDNKFNKLFFVLIITTFSRWYSYNPQILFRQCFIFVIIYYASEFADNIFYKKIKKRDKNYVNY